MKEQIRHGRRLETIGRLASGIAHDFNNILTVILSQSESILMFDEPLERIKIRAESIRSVVSSANKLTNQLLSISRKRRLSPRLLEEPNAIILSL